jgi:hypothetical protein
LIRRLAAAYFGGAIGAVANTLAVYAAGELGLLALVGAHLAPSLAWPTVSTRILWGSLWGLLFPLAARLAPGSPNRAGLLLGLAPAAAQLLYFFPHRGGGWLGLEHGWGTPVVVLLSTALWGFVTARTAVAAGGR